MAGIINWFRQRYWARALVNDRYKEKIALEKLTEQGLLAEIVKTCDKFTLRPLALKKITDPLYLADIAKNGKFIKERLQSANMLADVDKDLALNCYVSIVKSSLQPPRINEPTSKSIPSPVITFYFHEDLVAVDNLELRSNYDDTRYYIAALDKITFPEIYQSLCADLANNLDRGDYRRLRAAERLEDKELAQKVFTEIIKNKNIPSVHFMAAKLVTDQSLAQEVFLKIATETKLDKTIAFESVELIASEESLADIAKSALNAKIRLAAAKRLTDPALISAVVDSYLQRKELDIEEAQALLVIAKAFPDLIREQWARIAAKASNFHKDYYTLSTDCIPDKRHSQENRPDFLDEFPPSVKGDA